MKQQFFFSQFAQEGTPLVLGGDGRADSTGHSAKYGSYSVLELNHNNYPGYSTSTSKEIKICYVYDIHRAMRCQVAIIWNWKL